MKRRFLILSLIHLVATSSLFAQSEAPTNSPAAATAFQALFGLMPKVEQGGENPSADDLKTRRQAGLEIASKAKEFVKNFPASEQAEDAQGLWDIALSQAALAGEATAFEQLQTRVTQLLKDPEASEMLKLHTFAVNYLTLWAHKSGKRSLNDISPEFQKQYVEAFFGAVDVLSNKEPVFKMILLQAKSGRDLSAADKQSIAQRVLDHPAAPAAIKAEARLILSGEKAYAVGKPLDISFTAVDGRKVSLADLKGKVVLIDFWATWCGPCVGEVPAVKAAYDKYHADGFEIVGISLDDSKETLLRFVKEHQMPWPQYFDGKHWNNDISFRFGIDSVPTEWLVDRKGVLRSTNIRFGLEDAVDRLLNEK